MLHGKAIIDLHNIKTHRDERIVHDNMLTNYLRDVANQVSLNVQGIPTEQFGLTKPEVFGGLMMFGSALSNDADDYSFPSPHINRMIAHANNEAYSGADLTRGSYNSGQSSASDSGITQVWDFTQEQGNGTIASLGLCYTWAGLVGSGQPNLPETTAVGKYSSNWAKIITQSIDNPDAKRPSTVWCDTTNGKLVQAYLTSGGTLKVVRTLAPWSVYNPARSNIALNNAQYAQLAQSGAVEVKTFNLSSVLGSITGSPSFVTSDGKLYLISGASNWAPATTRTLVCFDLVAETYTSQSVTNNTGKTIYGFATNTLQGNLAIYDGYLYAQTTDSKLVYIKLTDNSDCGVVKAPDGTSDLAAATNTTLMVYGEMLCLMAQYNMTYSSVSYNNVNYVIMPKAASLYINISGICSSTGSTPKGIQVGMFSGKAYGAIHEQNANYNNIHPCLLPCLVTKNNLEAAVTKTADMTMRVTYTVTDQAE